MELSVIIIKKMIKTEKFCKEIDGNKILSDIDFQMEKGEFVAVMGPSGCGKSTFLYCISGMDNATSGKIDFNGKNICKLSEKEIERLRLEYMGFIFQRTNFLKNLSVEENIMFPAIYLKKEKRENIKERCKMLMEKTGISEIAERDIRNVSGGQLQRSAICRALINKPAVIFADEPTGALNSKATEEVMDIFTNIHKEGTSILVVTHDSGVAAKADKVVFMKDGRIYSELVLKDGDITQRQRKVRDIMNKIEI